MVLVLVPQRTSKAFFDGVLGGIDAELSAQGYTMIMGSLEGDDLKVRRLSDLVFARHLDGVLVVTGVVPRLDGRSILDAGVPVVAVCAEIDGASVPAVLIDDEGCAELQTDHLIGLGHRRLMYVSGSEGNYNEVRRYRGFANAVRRAGLAGSDLVRFSGDYSLESGVAAARCFLDMSDRPTGVVCASDEMAIGFVKTVSEAGVGCPDSVSVIGFDGIAFADFCEPTLTTIRQPRHQLGALGAAALLGMLQGREPVPHRLVLAAELDFRASTGPVPATSWRKERRVPRAASARARPAAPS